MILWSIVNSVLLLFNLGRVSREGKMEKGMIRVWGSLLLVTTLVGLVSLAQAEPQQTTASTPAAPNTPPVREDYFVSTDTLIIGCTAGAAAGILVGSVPVAGAMMSGIGVPESVNLLINLTGMGCGVGVASSAVAILTAWMLQPH
jgi:hypothetical protein